MKRSQLSNNLFWTGACLLAAAVPFAQPALLSIAGIILAAAGLLGAGSDNFTSLPQRHLFFASSLLVLIALLSYFYSDNKEEFWLRLSPKLSIFLMGAALLKRPLSNMKLKALLYWIFIASVLFVAVASTIHYFGNREIIDDMVSRSKPMPIFSGAHHIHFSLMQALAAGFLVYGWFHPFVYPQSRYQKALVASLFFVNIVCMHILTTRTGLLSFYAASFLMILYLLSSGSVSRSAWIGVFFILLLPVAAYFTASSFRNRVDNTWRDLQVTMNNKNNNFHSLSMRVEAWKTAWHVIEKNMLAGVGLGDANDEMQAQYIKDDTILIPENRLSDPHNQYLQNLLATGIPGLAALLYFLFAIFLQRSLRRRLLLMYSALLFMFAMNVETLLERQNSIMMIGLAFLMAIHISAPQQRKALTDKETA